MRALLLSLLTAAVMLAQPVERPPRPGEERVMPPERQSPVLDRDYKKLDRTLRPAFGASASSIVIPKGTSSGIFAGARYERIGFGLELGYVDYQREFRGSKISFVSPGDSLVCEAGSFVRPSAYLEYHAEAGNLTIVPRFKIGYASIICRRWYCSEPGDSTRFDRDRFINAIGLDLRYPIGPVKAVLSSEWLIVNPWFFVYPNDIGFLSIGFSLMY